MPVSLTGWLRESIMDEIIKEFVQESTENLDRLDQDFVKLESDPGNLELLKTIFRAVHTV
jgi:two-component system chemotaxis sensor kinase CheA